MLSTEGDRILLEHLPFELTTEGDRILLEHPSFELSSSAPDSAVEAELSTDALRPLPMTTHRGELLSLSSCDGSELGGVNFDNFRHVRRSGGGFEGGVGILGESLSWKSASSH